MRTKPRQRERLVNNQEGMVAITTTLIIMILISLVVSSFVLLVNREQRESLDRQLSTQAFYAAEAGIQDASDALGRAATVSPTAKNDCNGFAAGLSWSYTKDLSSNVKYSCVLVDTTPNNILKTDLDPVKGAIVIPIEPKTPLSSLKISWENSNGDLQFEDSARGNSFGLPVGNDALKTGMAKITIVPGFNAGGLTRKKIVDESQTVFLYPKTGAKGSVPYEPNGDQTRASQGQFVSGGCDASRAGSTFACASTITMPGSSMNQYFLVIKPLYRPITLEIQGFDAGSKVSFANAQAVIDSTGKAADVLRRIQVRVPITKGPSLRNLNSLLPEAGAESSQSLCKNLQVGNEVTDLCGGSATTHQFGDSTL